MSHLPGSPFGIQQHVYKIPGCIDLNWKLGTDQSEMPSLDTTFKLFSCMFYAGSRVSRC
jgi:hypothetical protein